MTLTSADYYAAIRKCPCCGSDPIVQKVTDKEFPWRIFCGNKGGVPCGISTPYVKLGEVAAEIWNRRRKGPKKAKEYKSRPPSLPGRQV